MATTDAQPPLHAAESVRSGSSSPPADRGVRARCASDAGAAAPRRRWRRGARPGALALAAAVLAWIPLGPVAAEPPSPGAADATPVAPAAGAADATPVAPAAGAADATSVAPSPGAAAATSVAPASDAAGDPPPDAPPPAASETGSLAMTAAAPADDGADSEDGWDDEWEDWDEDLDAVPSGYPDPFEPVNRVTLTFNNAIDSMVLDPVTRLYRFSLPDFARQAIVRILNNVNSPQVMVNDGLQLEWGDAGVITSRLLLNSTAGLGGIFDVAQGMGLEHHESDFGQTLTLAGVPAGTYLMLPLFGPANMRDTIGIGVDALLHPTFYLLPGTDLLLFGGSAGVVTRARHFEELQALKESSVDVYSAMRSGYYQNRQAEIWSRREDRRPAGEVGPGDGVGGFEDPFSDEDFED